MAVSQALIEKAKRYVRDGGTIEVQLPGGNHLGPTGVATMYLDEHQIRYTWVQEDKTHIHDVLWVDSDSDGQVLIAATEPAGTLLTVWTASWNARLGDDLKNWLRLVQSGQVPKWLEGGLDGAVSYGDV